MKIFRLLLLLVIVIVAVSWFTQTNTWKKTKALYFPKKESGYLLTAKAIKKMEQKAAEAKLFVQRKKLYENTCFLIDMSLPSG